MAEFIKTLRDVSLNLPRGSCPELVDFPQRGVASTPWAKTVRMVTELRFVVRLKDEAYHFLHQFIAPHRHAKRPVFPVFLGNVRPSCW